MKIAATIEARMGSSRFPGKVLMPLGGRPVLERIVERVSKARYVDEVVVATTVKEADDKIVELCEKIGAKYYRGSEDDVLDRVLNAAKSVGADTICELMGDSPMLDPVIIDNVITGHLSGVYDYTSNFYPENTYPMGFAVQVFPVAVLERVARLTQDPIDRVHVTCFIYQHPEMFTLNGVCASPAIRSPEYRLSLDTREDYEVIGKVFDALYPSTPGFECKDIVGFLREHPEIARINSAVRQKAIEEG